MTTLADLALMNASLPPHARPRKMPAGATGRVRVTVDAEFEPKLDRVDVTDDAHTVEFHAMGAGPPGGGNVWHYAIVEHGIAAALEVADEFAKIPDTRSLTGNVLVEISNRLSDAIRRRMLEEIIGEFRNLSHVARHMRMANATAVLKEARRLGVKLPEDRRGRGAQVKSKPNE